jgi:hypothetical protein
MTPAAATKHLSGLVVQVMTPARGAVARSD